MKIILGLSGASGAIYGIKTLELLRQSKVETHLIVSKWGEYTIQKETTYSIEQVKKMADVYYETDDLAASISSGSFKTDGMIVAPCSMKALGGIASGFNSDLMMRAADVCIKEKRKLLLLTRETPLSAIHLENMLKLSRTGAIIMPPVPAFYTAPKNIDDIVMQTVGRILDCFGIEISQLIRWQE